MSEEDTHFIDFDEEGNIILDRASLRERLDEEGMEEAIEYDEVTVGFVTE